MDQMKLLSEMLGILQVYEGMNLEPRELSNLTELIADYQIGYVLERVGWFHYRMKEIDQDGYTLRQFDFICMLDGLINVNQLIGDFKFFFG